MNLETFFEKFDLFADCPNAVQKMRELILELAVQGKLVDQDQGWAVDDNKPFSIPSNWEWSSLSLLGEMSGGMTPSKSDSSYWDGGVPWFSSKDIKSEELLSSELTISEKGLKETRLRLYPPGCIFIVARSGILKRTLPVSINRVAASVNQDLKVFQPARDLEIRYIQVALKGLERSILTEYVKTGTTVQSLKYDEFEAMPIPLPPLAEQKRIVAKVDELMALCDALEAQQKERETKRAQIAKASLAAFADAPSPTSLELLFHPSFAIDPADLRKSILTLAVQGKLVAQDPGDEDARELFERICVRKQGMISSGELKKDLPSRPVTLQEIDHDIPDTWRWVRFVDVCELITDGTHQTPKYTESGRMFLSAQNVKPFRFMPNKHRFVSEEDYQGYIRSRKPEKGDVLLTRVGAGIGEAATIDQDLEFAIYVSLGLVRPARTLMFSDYVTLWLNSPDGTAKSSRFTLGKGVSQGNLNLSLIRNFLFPLPPLAEQKRIVAKVDELMALVDRLESKIVASREAGSRLLEAMVAELSGKAA